MKTATEIIKPIVPKMDPITVATIESRNVTKKQDNDNHAASKSNYGIMFYHKVFLSRSHCVLLHVNAVTFQLSTYNHIRFLYQHLPSPLHQNLKIQKIGHH